MAKKKIAIAVIGAGMGGLTAAAALRRIGADVQVYEQAHQFARVGAGIQMLPNAMKVLRGIGIEERLRQIAFEPVSHLNREWDTGAIMRELPMSETTFGAPYLCMHRAELHDALLSLVPRQIVHLDKKLVGLDQQSRQVTLTFADGTTSRADAVIGADGIHSIVREIVVGPDRPIHKGRIAYRAVYPTALLNGRDLGPSRTKWWGIDRHIVIYYTTATRSEISCVNHSAGSGTLVTK